MIEYKAVAATIKTKGISELVSNELKNGWSIVGGIAVGDDRNGDLILFQAMTKTVIKKVPLKDKNALIPEKFDFTESDKSAINKTSPEKVRKMIESLDVK